MMDRRLRVALLIESSRAYGRGLLGGIAAYSRAHGPWSIYHNERSMAEDAPAWLRGWRGDGVIARLESRRLIQQLERLGLPTVDLRGRHDVPGIPLIETNDKAVVKLTLDHLAERGFRHFAFCGFRGANYSARRLKYFVPAVRALGLEAHVFEGPLPDPRHDDTGAIEAGGLTSEELLAKWLGDLPRPVGIMACNDVRGQQVLSVCRELRIAVPDEVAVVGVDNDEVICELCDPPLSSVEPDTHRIGYEAAALLERMVRGHAAPAGKIFIDPVRIVTRRSTDVLAVADPEIATAVRFIREHACAGIGVEDVLEKLRISRSTLERRFVALLGRPPKAEILRVQIERVKQLLEETDYPLSRIARLSGFKHVEYMCTLFKSKVGQTPGRYRAAKAN